MKKLVVNHKYNGKKLNKFLLENIPSLSSNLFYKTLRKKDIKINQQRVSENVTVFEKDEVLVYISDHLLNQTLPLNVFFEDENILVLNKPYELEVTGENSLTSLVHQNYSNCAFQPMPCHRIDRNTTGLVLFAKNESALKILLNKFKHHEIEKHYLAFVSGHPPSRNKRCEAYLFKDTKKARVYISDQFKKGYQKIVTTYHVLENYDNNTSLLDVEIETGKTHQIRAHLSYLGFPIIGDRKIWSKSNE
ncbi:MAG: RluA family pseudouridine synthase [Clostridia bacterium]|nr:RluA family pseudouridine synthase [Clostridia bacterium]